MAFKFLGAGVVGSLFLSHVSCGDEAKPREPVRVQVLAINDFHGNLEAPSGSNGRITVPSTTTDGGVGTVDVNAGGATYLAHHISKLREENPNTVVVSAGDLIGASPLVSGIFHDEPTIELMNLIGLDINGVGNHEFDDGQAELLRMQNGGCHADGCQGATTFTGAKFKFLSANVFKNVATKETLLPPYEIKEFEGVKVAFIGMTLEGTSKIVNPAGIGGLTFQDEADTVNALVPDLKAQGVEAIVVVLHEGGMPTGAYDACPGISGPIVELTERFDDAVDVVVSGHTHQAYNCVIDGKRVTSAASHGRLVTDIDLVLDPTTRDVVEATARNVIVTRDTATPQVDTFVSDYVSRAAPLANRVIGNTPVELKLPPRPLPPGQGGDYSMGRVVADAMLAATSGPQVGNAVIALQNPGGVRADINVGDITYSEVFTVQPFANNMVTMTLTGAQIERVLEQQFRGTTRLVMQVSEGFTYAWSESAPVGQKIDPASITLHGTPIRPDAEYRVTVNNFMASGGDDYLVFTEGKDLLTGDVDTNVLEAYLRSHNPLTPPAQGRITVLP
ncbi:bifunctional metallophosphatase/5'-nucleotidase [Hyalangium rubrum]|uniref:Bifunctional metallophosphatase/5'-nucleotidase n=1 Tax=Hyalangium rubrum TaxID=3103134 RepID=A0ABU5HEB8_9BACT|nr:bifunctional metallophosphatase/5'-nucleotidase [Hyalangium sp. s54d21]MDY7231701.1 bifunctional metallophosphatase/5'-nucleotidase [Hyalangium sp. s54d21]